MAWTLAGFVGGVVLLQWQARLPSPAAIAVLGLAALVLGLGAARAGRRIVLAAHLAGAAPTAERIGVRAVAALAAALLGFAYAAAVAQVRLADELPFADEGRDLVVRGVIASLPAALERGAVRFEFAVDEVRTADARVPARLSLAWYGAGAIEVLPAQRWEFTVRLRRPHGTLNPGGFDLEAWLIERGLRATGTVRDTAAVPPRRLAERVLQPGPLIDRARADLRDRLQQRLGAARYGGVLVALVLGDQRAIGAADWQMFAATGITHLVSISGLHVTMIAALVAAAAAALWRRSPAALARVPVQQVAAVAAVLAALGYCLLAGWGVPAQRTFFMLALVALALSLRVAGPGATTLAAAAALVCMLDPWAAIAPGFWLSFGAVAAILWSVQARATPVDWRQRLATAAWVQGAVTLALVPLTIVLFQQVSLVAPLANAVAIPVVSLAVTPLALLAALCAWLPAPLDASAGALLALAHALFAVLADGLHALARWPATAVAVAAPPPWALLLAAVGVAWMLAPRGWPLRPLGAVWLLPVFVVPPPRPAADELWVTAVDVGQGMAVLLQTARHTVLYDTGPRYRADSDAGTRIVVPLLRRHGIGRLDLLVVSHLDSDHSGGVAAVRGAVRTDAVWSSIPASHALLAGAPATRCQAGQQHAFGALSLRVLHPAPTDYQRRASTNALSCVVEVRFGVVTLLLTGDLPARAEAELLAREPLSAVTLVTAPHHGSRHSSSPAFVAAVQPRWVLVQAGYRNRFGHPDGGVLARWQQAGAIVVRTDHHGAVQWRLAAGGQAQVEAARFTQARYWHNRPAAARSLATDDEGEDDDGTPPAVPRAPDEEDPAGFLLD